MSDRFASVRTPDQLRTIFGIGGQVPNWPPCWNVAPNRKAPVVCARTAGRSIELLTWGFRSTLPSDERREPAPHNARAETVTSSRLFGEAFRERRCLVPVDAFYEWCGPTAARRPFAFARMDGRPAALGGFWSRADPDDDHDDHEPEASGTFAILTVEASPALHALHERLPVVVEEPSWAVWLGEEGGDVETLLRASAPFALRSWPVGSALEDPDNDGPALLEPID